MTNANAEIERPCHRIKVSVAEFDLEPDDLFKRQLWSPPEAFGVSVDDFDAPAG